MRLRCPQLSSGIGLRHRSFSVKVDNVDGWGVYDLSAIARIAVLIAISWVGVLCGEAGFLRRWRALFALLSEVPVQPVV